MQCACYSFIELKSCNSSQLCAFEFHFLDLLHFETFIYFACDVIIIVMWCYDRDDVISWFSFLLFLWIESFSVRFLPGNSHHGVVHEAVEDIENDTQIEDAVVVLDEQFSNQQVVGDCKQTREHRLHRQQEVGEDYVVARPRHSRWPGRLAEERVQAGGDPHGDVEARSEDQHERDEQELSVHLEEEHLVYRTRVVWSECSLRGTTLLTATLPSAATPPPAKWSPDFQLSTRPGRS